MQRGDKRLLAPIQEASEAFLTPVVIGELLFGFLGGGLEPRNRSLLREFVQSPRVAVLPLDDETAERYAIIRGYLRQQGTPIPINDLWIAASAAQHGLRLLTLDDHFKRVPQVLVEYFEPRS
jgi:tRNA(fMet)-specific endonuclease VapC